MNEFEIFLGTGGVGKTTLAYTRALHIAKKNSSNKVLIITIDPSHRLKDFIKLNQVSNLEVHLFNPAHTFKDLLKTKNLSPTRISSIIMGRWGGMNEFLALLELHKRFYTKDYTHIILDTAPGKHFTDFLENNEKIISFFSKRFISLFTKKKTAYFQKIINFGVERILQVFQSFTSLDFVNEFVDTLKLMYALSKEFQDALETQERYLCQKAKWFIVFNGEQAKFQETMQTFKGALSNQKVDKISLINRYTDTSELQSSKSTSDKENKLINYIHLNQKSLIENVEKEFKNNLIFKDVHGPSIIDHVKYLTNTWDTYDLSN